MAAAVSQGPSRRAHPLSRRHRRQIILSEGRAEIRARLDSPRAGVERRHAARDRVLRLRRRRVAAIPRQHGDDPPAHLGQPRRLAGAARLVHSRSRSQGGAIRARRNGGEGGAAAVRRHRVAVLHQDERLDGTARVVAAGPAGHLRAMPPARRTARAGDHRGAAGDFDGDEAGRKAGRAGVPRLPAERPRAAAGGPL